MDIAEIEDISLREWGAGTPGRSAGLHLSDVIKGLMRELEPERFKNGPIDALKVEAGFAYERVLENGLRAKFDWQRPQEFHKDGIACSPDGICVDERQRLIVEELKCTWMSSKDAPHDKKFWHWLVQIKAYCYVVNTFYARLRAFFVNGSYHRHNASCPASCVLGGPEFKCWELQFTARELAENWSMLQNFAKSKGMLR